MVSIGRQCISLKIESREAVVVRRMPTAAVADVQGVLVWKWGSEGAADGQFRGPKGVAVDADHVCVSGISNNRVQVFCRIFRRPTVVLSASGVAEDKKTDNSTVQSAWLLLRSTFTWLTT
jgi:hypothetical protein